MGLIEIYHCDDCQKESSDSYYWLNVTVMGEFGSKKFYFCSASCMTSFFLNHEITYDEGVPILREK